MVSTCTSFILPLNELVIYVKQVIGGGKTFGSLVDSWVLLDNVQVVMRNSSSLVAFPKLISKRMVVDEVSLSRFGPMRTHIS